MTTQESRHTLRTTERLLEAKLLMDRIQNAKQNGHTELTLRPDDEATVRWLLRYYEQSILDDHAP
ncbi:hypothetical protein DH09_00395 (plasmid) [Bacillaceae bacterium JMAK1]|nr:hypothetical protein DH09_00395 [Bacillaceae bacterium JMAK1]